MLKKLFGKLEPPKADIRLSEDGSIFIEGKYYFYRNNKRSKGETAVKIDNEDVLRIGKRTISSTKLMVAGVGILIAALFCFSKTAELSAAVAAEGAATVVEGIGEQGAGTIIGAGESVGNLVGIGDGLEDLSELAIEGEIKDSDRDYSQSLIDSGTDKISEGEETIESSVFFFVFMAIITGIVILAGGLVLVCYLFTIRKYIEVFTEYGSFCVPEAYVDKGTLDALILKRNMIGR